MRAMKVLLATAALSLPAAPAAACPEDGVYHRFFAFAGQIQSQHRAPEPSRDRGERPAPQDDGGSSGQDQPQPDQSGQPNSGPAEAADAATFR